MDGGPRRRYGWKMSIEVQRPTISCSVCAAKVTELRRGRCWGCYLKWSELRPVGKGAACAVCDERRRDNLRMTEIHGRSLPMCHTCGARALRLAPLPHSIEGLRAALRRDRRGIDRRDDAADQRIFPRERRISDRRGPVRELALAETDPAVMLRAGLGAFDVEIELGENDIDLLEPTVVREMPRPTEK
jgi:hypothetical protein